MKALKLIILLFIITSCAKEQNNICLDAKPEVNLHSVIVTDTTISGSIQNISPCEDYISEIHGRVFITIASKDTAIEQNFSNNALSVIKKGKVYFFLIENELNTKELTITPSFLEYSTK